MAVQKSFGRVLCSAAAGVLLAGCGDNTHRLSSSDLAAFNNASPEMKQTWERGLTASKANDYLMAQTNLASLLSGQITPEQLIAVQTALSGLNQRIHEAADKGDAAARQALESVKPSAR